jgi:hypothetical protein
MTKRMLIGYLQNGYSSWYQRANMSFTQDCCRQGQSPFLETRIALESPFENPPFPRMLEGVEY